MKSECLRIRVGDKKILVQLLGADPQHLIDDPEMVQKILKVVGKEMGTSYLIMHPDAYDIGLEHDYPDFIVRVEDDGHIGILDII